MSTQSSFAAIPPATLEKQTVRKLFLRLLPFLFLLYIVSYLDRINVGFAKLQMQGQLGFSERVFGDGFGVFFLGYFILQVPSNLLLERIGVRKWIAGLMVVWGLVSCSMIFVRTPQGFYVLRFLLGAAEAGFFPGMILYMKYWFPAKARAQAVAWFMTANPLAGVFGSPISGALLGVHGFGLQGWQWLFVLEAVPAILLGFVVYWVLPERPMNARWLSDPQKAWLVAELARESSSSAGLQKRELLAALGSGRVWMLTAVYFGLPACMYGVTLWLPSAIHGAGLSFRATGLVAALPFIVTAIVMVLIGMHSDKVGERRWHTAVSAFVGVGGLTIAAVFRSPVALILGMSIGMVGAEAMCGPFWAMATHQIKDRAAAGIAIINSFANLGGYFGPFIIGLFRTSNGGYQGGMIAIALVLATSGTVAAVVGAEKKEPRTLPA
jgi:MFS transporter, ACS family, tartrate transporter